jgi:putative oxidoreductase
MKIQALVTSSYAALRKAGDAFQSPFLLMVRLYWGYQFMQSGWGKLHNLNGVTEFFTNLGIPAPHLNAIFVANLEFFGGLLLILGLANRLLGLVLTGNMLAAYLTADRDALKSIFSEPSKFYNADPYTFLFTALLVLIFGAGFFSLDQLIASRRVKAQRAQRPEWPMPQSSQIGATPAL